MLAFSFTPFPVLTTDRLTLRPLGAADAPALHALRSDPRVMQFIPRPLAQSVEEVAAFIAQANSRTASNELINWGIARHEDNAVIGAIGYYSRRPEHFRAEIGYMLHPAHQGRGLMQKAVAAALDYGFDAMALHSIEAVMGPANTASARVGERNGFLKEGHFRENEFWDGKFTSAVFYSLLRTDRR